jgi:hypothetical protein
MKDKPNSRCVKCPKCNEYELWNDRESMIKVKIKNANKYLHDECYEPFMEELKEQQKGEKEKTHLFSYIKELHEVDMIPPIIAVMIEQVRTGSKKNKMFSYKTILSAYQISTKKCKYFIKAKNFESKISEMIYCFKIVTGNILKVQQKEMKNNRSQEIAEAKQKRLAETNQVNNDRRIEYKRKEYEDDILDFLE